MAITEKGEIILVGEGGSIIIKKMEGDRYKKEEQLKKWFEKGDMSWLEGSVWTSKINKPISSIKRKISDLEGIERMDSIRLNHDDRVMLSDKSIGGLPIVSIPNVVL